MENRAEREYVELEEAVRGGAMIFRRGRNFWEGVIWLRDGGGWWESGEFLKGVRVW